MSIINKVAEEALRQNRLLAQMSNISYNAINGKRQNRREFFEGILNAGKLDDQMKDPTEKITKEMIMDYKREQEERSFKDYVNVYDTFGNIVLDAAGEPVLMEKDVKYQPTGIKENLETYKPLYTGDEIDIKKQSFEYETLVRGKTIAERKLKDIEDKITKTKQELMILEGKYTKMGVSAASVMPDYIRKRKQLEEENKKRSEILIEIASYQPLIDNKITLINQIEGKINANIKEKARVDDINKNFYKDYGDKFNLLNRDRISATQQPYETDEQYYRRIRELEQTAFDPNIYKDKAIIEENRKLKKNLEQLLKDPSKIENIIKSFSKPEDIYTINNNWTKIFNFIKNKLGVNNRFATVEDYLKEITNAVKNIQSSQFNILQTTKNKPKAENDVLILTNPAGQNLYIKLFYPDIYYSNILNNSYKKFTFTVRGTNDFKTIIKNFNPSLIPTNAEFKKLFGEAKTKKDVYNELIKKINTSVINPATLTGTGLKKGRGMAQEEKVKDLKKENIDESEIPRIINFGKNKILLHRLYYKNILSLKDSKGHNIERLPIERVSDDFVKIIIMMYETETNTDELIKKINKLEENEHDLLNLILDISGLSKKNNIDVKKNDNVKKLKDRLNLVQSQIMAGNNNPEVKKELKQIVNKLYLYGAISLNNSKEYIKQF